MFDVRYTTGSLPYRLPPPHRASKLDNLHQLGHLVTAVVLVTVLDAILFSYTFSRFCGPGSSVGIAPRYRLDGPGSHPGGDEIFRPSTEARGPTQPPLKCVPGLSRG